MAILELIFLLIFIHRILILIVFEKKGEMSNLLMPSRRAGKKRQAEREAVNRGSNVADRTDRDNPIKVHQGSQE